MLSAIGQCITLATFADARLKGRKVSLDLATNPWFQHHDVDFAVGEGGQDFGNTFDSWVSELARGGFTRAYLWIEPFDRDMRTINSMAFVGFARWAPVTVMPDLEIIWHEKMEEGPTSDGFPTAAAIASFQARAASKPPPTRLPSPWRKPSNAPASFNASTFPMSPSPNTSSSLLSAS